MKLPASARWILLSGFISNIGNGLHTITVGLILYNVTHSISAFGIVILMEYLMSFVLQMFAGLVVDRFNPKYVYIASDILCGTFITIASFWLGSGAALAWVFAATVIINVTTPFYRSAGFALGPAVSKGDLLTKYNSMSASLLQTGQLLGTGLAGIVLSQWGPGVAFGINGISYLLAVAAILMATIPAMELKERGNVFSKHIFFSDWKEALQVLRDNRALGTLIILCSGDFLTVNFLNLTLVPMVNHWYNGNRYWLSVFDGSFAIGWIIVGYIGLPLIKKWGKRWIILLGMLAQAFVFMSLLGLHQNPLVIITLITLLGIFNALSMTVYMTTIQQQSVGPIKGRISSIRQFSLSILAACIIPVVTSAHTRSLSVGLTASAVICALFGVSTFLASRAPSLRTSLNAALQEM